MIRRFLVDMIRDSCGLSDTFSQEEVSCDFKQGETVENLWYNQF